MKLGARMLKTGIAVSVALYIATLIGLPSATYTGIAAAFAIQPNIFRSFQTMFEQIYANILGVIFAAVVVFTLGNDPIIIGITTIIVIGVCMYLKMNENTISLAIIAVLAVMESTEMMLFNFAGLRLFSLTLGIVTAFFVNMLFFPPKYELRLFKQIDQMTADILQWLRISTRHLSDDPALKGEIDRLDKEITYIDNTYSLYSEERIYRRKSRVPKMRKLVIFRQMIVTSKKSLETLRAFYQYDDKIDTIPKEFQQVLFDELDKIIYSHERLLLSAMGKIKKNQTKSVEDITTPRIPHLVDTLIKVYEKNETERLSLLPLASRLLEYHKEILHLQKLLYSYQKFHENINLNFKKRRRRIVP
ncbi:aromatic acid exporter family protein [Gracilibacillus oryzae]|uniref:Aromatic acid exporter family protein n=1 Tax=Gracilibacillus oryzae TaxID=1672701 RepID=A0A7C8KW21_9BACI|nr:aromatic acid exporter family protein [Gracilibacillus oryzae]KAB8125620.1 aromatic acid exporter family protein [Gracilibacillus oryzae]